MADVFARGDIPEGPTEAEITEPNAKVGRLVGESYLSDGLKRLDYNVLRRPGLCYESNFPTQSQVVSQPTAKIRSTDMPSTLRRLSE